MEELIRKSDVVKVIDKKIQNTSDYLQHDALIELEADVEEIPIVEAVQVVHGEWVNEYINRYGHPCHCCSVCGFHASHQDKNFCPECGADMRKKVQYEQI